MRTRRMRERRQESRKGSWEVGIVVGAGMGVGGSRVVWRLARWGIG